MHLCVPHNALLDSTNAGSQRTPIAVIDRTSNQPRTSYLKPQPRTHPRTSTLKAHPRTSILQAQPRTSNLKPTSNLSDPILEIAVQLLRVAVVFNPFFIFVILLR